MNAVRLRRPNGAVVLVAMLVATLASGLDAPAWTAYVLAQGDPVTAALDAPPRRGQPVHVAVVVTDGRVGTATLGDKFGPLTGARADAVVVLEVSRDQVVAVGVPRGLRVSTSHGDVTLASVRGVAGRAGMVHAIRDATTGPVHHYVEFDLVGVAAVVDALGGLQVDLPHAVRDRWSGLQAAAGHQRLDGPSAVAWLRSRHLEARVDETWIQMPAGDLARMDRTQRALQDVVATLGDLPVRTQARALTALTRHAVPDATLLLGSGVELATRLPAADTVCTSIVPTRAERPVRAATSPLGPAHRGALQRRVLDGSAPTGCGG